VPLTFCMTMAQTIAASAMVEPTERSMPPVMITSVTPSVTMPTNEKFLATFARLPGLKKALLRVDMMTMMAMSATAT
jgi:hypothetical protein